jgi:hypothetical protein
VFAHSWKHGETLVGNNVSATMFPSLPRALIQGRPEGQYLWALFVLIISFNQFYSQWSWVTIHTYKRSSCNGLTNLQQTCSNTVSTTCQQDVFALLVPSLLRLVGNLLQGCWVQQTCYKLFQQLVIVLQFNNSTWWNNSIVIQLLDKFATRLLRTHLVDKL